MVIEADFHTCRKFRAYKTVRCVCICVCVLRGVLFYTSHFSIHRWNTVSFECHQTCSTPGTEQRIRSPRAASVFRPKTSLKYNWKRKRSMSYASFIYCRGQLDNIFSLYVFAFWQWMSKHHGCMDNYH